MSKVTITVEDGASHSVRVTRTARPTGQDYESVEVGAGDEQTFEVGDEENLTVQLGQPTPKEEEPADKASKKK